MSNLRSFLKNETSNSAEKLVRTMANELKKASFASNLVTRLVVMLTVLHGLNMIEEVRLVGLLILSRFGAKDQVVPPEVSSLMSATASKPTATVTPIKVVAPPAPKPAASPTAAKPVQTAPARTLVDSKKWFGFLRDIVGGKTDQKTMRSVQGLTIQIFHDGFKLLAEDWKLFFAALKAANKGGQHIVEKEANPPMIFKLAPVALVRDFIFGQDGFLVILLAEIGDHAKEEMAPWMCAKTNICLDAVEEVDIKSKLDDTEATWLGRLINLLKAKQGPGRLIQKAEDILNGADLDTIHRRAMVTSDVMAEKFKMAGLKSSEPEPTPAAIAKPAVTPEPVDTKKSKKVRKAFKMSLGNTPPVVPQPETVTAPAEATSTATPVNTEPEPAAPAVAAELVASPTEPDGTTDDNGGKPSVDSDFEEQFAAMMLEEGQKSVPETIQPINGKMVNSPSPLSSDVAMEAATIN
jgi:hypothetical protein